MSSKKILWTGIIKFEQFLNKADFLLKSFGLLLYLKAGNEHWNARLMNLIFLVCVLNLILVIASETTFIVVSFISGKHFVEATMNLSCIGFASVSLIKIYTILHNKSKLLNLIKDLRKIFPRHIKDQQYYKAHSFLGTYSLISKAYIIIHMLLIWSFNFSALIFYLIMHYIMNDGVLEPFLPYSLWTPWNWHGNWTYYLLYFLLCFAGQCCISAQLANDLLFGATTTNLIMHYRHLALKLNQYIARVHSTRNKENHKLFLNNFIQCHQKILRFSDTINEVFGISLLINFLSSALIMCFLGFVITIGIPIHYIVILLLFLFCSLVQAYMISNYGQKLSDASSSIGDAVYNHDWYAADLSYKKTMVIIMQRAQKPAFLKATYILNITLGTMTVLIQVSYKCFAMLRLLYAE